MILRPFAKPLRMKICLTVSHSSKASHDICIEACEVYHSVIFTISHMAACASITVLPSSISYLVHHASAASSFFAGNF